MIKYNKLVRDNIPQIIEDDGSIAITHIAGDSEYRQKVAEKLQEELDEFLASDGDPSELADMLEVIYAFCDLLGVSRAELEEIRQKKEQKRGAFKKRIILDQTDNKK